MRNFENSIRLKSNRFRLLRTFLMLGTLVGHGKM